MKHQRHRERYLTPGDERLLEEASWHRQEILSELSVIKTALMHVLINQARLERKVMADLTRITEEVEENTTVVASAVALIKGLRDEIAAAGTDPQKLADLVNKLDTQNRDLADAVAANTPAEGGSTGGI